MSRTGRIRSAFTVIEMMVVVSIMALLISMLQPALQASRHHARIAQCASNQRQLAVGITAYADDTRHYPVGIDHHTDNNQRIWLWPTQVRMYTQNEQDVFQCPQAPGYTRWVKQSAPGEPAFYGYQKDEMRIRGFSHKFSYGYNVWGAFMGMNPNTGLGIYRLHPYGDATPFYSVKMPADMIAFADSNPNDYWSGFIGPYRTGQWPSRIHFQKANVAFVDTHVELIAQAEVVDVMANPSMNKKWNNDHAVHPGSVSNDGVPQFPN